MIKNQLNVIGIYKGNVFKEYSVSTTKQRDYLVKKQLQIGQKKDVDIYYQIFKGTQYEKIWNTVMKKELVINQVIKKEDEK